MIPRSQVFSVLKELGLNIDEAEAKALFDEFDTDISEGLDLQELQLLLQKPSRLHEWAKGLSLHELLADAMPRKPGIDPLRVASALTAEEISAVCEAVRFGLERMLKASSAFLREAFRASDQRKDTIEDSKFSIVAVSCGTIQDFHAGVEGRTGEFLRMIIDFLVAVDCVLNLSAGTPSLKFEKAMEAEHCNCRDSLKYFTTRNYKVTTCPRREWMFVAEKKCEDGDLRYGRVARDVDVLLKDYNKLVSQEDAKIQRTEVIAIVLYTGPMVGIVPYCALYTFCPHLAAAGCPTDKSRRQFQVYNTVLRRFPKSAYEQQCLDGNMYSTTIYVLVSAVLNVARETRLPAGLKLYRGLGGDKTFPSTFYKSDDKGRKGILEWGFMSTTSSMSVALQYSGIKQGMPFPTILEIDSGAVDRGADLTSFSQYPGLPLRASSSALTGCGGGFSTHRLFRWFIGTGSFE